jgi:hypothetical protein
MMLQNSENPTFNRSHFVPVRLQTGIEACFQAP